MQLKHFPSLNTILFLSLLFVLQTACITKSKQTDYMFIIDEKLLSDSMPLVKRITQFKCENCPVEMRSEYQRLHVPSKTSKFFIYNDSTKTGKIVDIYKYNWIENIASSSPNPLRYFNNLNRAFKTGLENIPGPFFKLDSLLTTIDSSRRVFSNFEYSNSSHSVFIGSLNKIADSLFRIAITMEPKKGELNQPIIIYLKSGFIHPGPEFNPKKEIYQTMRLFYERLSLLYENDISSSEKEAKKDLIKKSFRPGAIFEIQNKDETKPTHYTIDQFLDRITSDKKFQYEDVSFFMDKFSFFKEPEPVSDSEIPGKLEGIANYNQHFSAANNGIIVYQDIVNKSVKVSMEPIIVSDKFGVKKPAYQFIIESITVNYVNK